MNIYTQIKINAPSELVWQVLTNFQCYADWNTFILSISGELAIGNSLQVSIQPPNGHTMQFRPTITQLINNQTFEWCGKVFIKGIFDGKHRFELSSLDQHSTLFTHSEDFSGIAVRFINLSNTEEGFKIMNHQLKTYVERLYAQQSLVSSY